MSQAGKLSQKIPKIGESAFLARVDSIINNVTGNGASYNVVFDRTVFDINSDFNTGTGVFTAPVTGIYQFNSSVYLSGIAGATGFRIRLITSNRNYIVVNNGAPLSAEQSLDLSTLADMDVGDTAYVEIVAAGQGANTVDVFGGSSQQTSFSGVLLFET